MKIRVSYTIDADDDYRRAIRAYGGDDGLATRAEIQEWARRYGDSMDTELAIVLDQERGERDGWDEG